MGAARQARGGRGVDCDIFGQAGIGGYAKAVHLSRNFWCPRQGQYRLSARCACSPLQLSFDMSLARGLDYYTGIIYEAITESSAPPSFSANPSVPPTDSITSDTKSKKKSAKEKDSKAEDGPDESTVGVGSIAAGGRYDNLVGMFSEAAGMGKKDPVPCVGVSVGVERVYSIMEMRRRQGDLKIRGKETEVLIMNFGKEGLLKERMALAKKLRDAGIKVGGNTVIYRAGADV